MFPDLEEVSDDVQSFNAFVRKYNLKNKATSNINIQQVLSFLSLNDVGIILRDGPFESDTGIVNLHPTKGTHWVCYINENYFDGCGYVCPKKLSKFIMKGNGYCFNSEYKTQGLTKKRDSYDASFCLYTLVARVGRLWFALMLTKTCQFSQRAAITE